MGKLDGKVALISGTGRGMGRAAALVDVLCKNAPALRNATAPTTASST